MVNPPGRSEHGRRSPPDRPARRRAQSAALPSALPSLIGNAAVGRLLRSVAAERTLARDVPAESAVRDYEMSPDRFIPKMTAEAERELGANDRPNSRRFWVGYDPVSYARIQGEENVNQVWSQVGGSVGDDFQGQNTCATRVSFAFNHIGWPVRRTATTPGMWKVKAFPNDPKQKYAGKAGDGKLYIVGAPDMESYLRTHWGKPDMHAKTNVEVAAFEKTLAPGQIAIFAGPHHSGVIMGHDGDGQGYDDAYAKFDPGVMPVSAWILPGSAGSPGAL